jgi:signal transduction histidine kinase
VLWGAFAAVLLLMLFTSMYATQALQRLQQASVSARRVSRERNQLLDGLRTGIYHASTVLRDYLAENDNEKALGHRLELEQVRKQIESALSEYEAKLPEHERAAFGGLRAQVASYGKSLESPLAWTAAERARLGDIYLQSSVIPRRQQAVDLVQRIELLNESEVENVERELVSSMTSLRSRIAFFSGAAMLLGTLIAVLSALRIRSLERESERRYEQVAQARTQLSQLSGRLLNAQEEERRKLSRELHDQLGQTSAALVAELAHLEREVENGPRRDRITAARLLAEESVRSIRDVSLLLRPSMLDDLGLLPAIRWQVREVRRRTQLKVHINADDIAEDLSDPVRTCIYRVVQEALNNCVKHSDASAVSVELHQNDTTLSVRVQDDGHGFHPANDKGIGLLGMGERVQRLGGVLAIQSQPGQGTILSVSLPLEIWRVRHDSNRISR